MWYLIVVLTFVATVAAIKRHQLDIVQQAGLHVIYSFTGKTIPADLLAAAENGSVGGIITFGANIGSGTPDQITGLQTAYAKSRAYAGVPLIITTDQEGGEVNRLPGGPALSAKEIGQSTDPAAAAANAGADIASVFKTYNHNADLAPVLGVYRSPNDFLDEYERSFGNNSALVTKCAGPFISHMQGNGKVAATAKHFPGLGAANQTQNTDEQPVTLHLSLEDIRKVDEMPFIAAIKAGVKMIMPSWAVYPALDARYPSGLSRKWLQNELRERLGFKGVLISDAITAGALQDFGTIEQRAVLAVQAGIDIIVVTGNNPSDGVNVAKALADAVQRGEIEWFAWNSSNHRVFNLRKGLQ